MKIYIAPTLTLFQMESEAIIASSITEPRNVQILDRESQTTYNLILTGETGDAEEGV